MGVVGEEASFDLKDVTCVTLCYNSGHVVEECLKSIPPECSSIVVDNASADDTVSRARAARPDAAILSLTENLGYSGGCNAGLERATTPFVMVLNPDLRLRPDTMHRLLSAMRRFPDAAILGPGVAGSDTPVGYTPGESMFMHRERVQALGFFDAKMFFYYEDNDLCDRVLKAGWGVVAPSDVVVDQATEQSTALGFDHTMTKRRLLGASLGYYATKNSGSMMRSALARKKFRSYILRPFACLMRGDLKKSMGLWASAWGMADYALRGETALWQNRFTVLPRTPARRNR